MMDICIFRTLSFSASDSSSGSSGASSDKNEATGDEATTTGEAKDSTNNGSAAEPGTAVEGEDTMKNLRKTFAGIFGDIN